MYMESNNKGKFQKYFFSRLTFSRKNGNIKNFTMPEKSQRTSSNSEVIETFAESGLSTTCYPYNFEESKLR